MTKHDLSLDEERTPARLQPLIDLVNRQSRSMSDIQMRRGLRHVLPAVHAPPRSRVPLRASLAVAAAVAAVLLVRFFEGPPALVMRVEHASFDGASGRVAPTEPGQPARLHFSDGSDIELAQQGQIEVVKLNGHGARLALKSGKLHARIAPKRRASWDFDSGPFRVHVVGTRFTLQWDEKAAALSLVMRSGRVTVSGPLVGNVLPVEAGQSLTVKLNEGQVRLRGADEAAPPNPHPASAAVADEQAPALAPAEGPRVPPPARQASTVRRADAWSRLLREGALSQIVTEARAVGVERVLRQSSLAELQALADAARYLREDALALRALQAQRARFAASKSAHEAAFHLGRIEETSGAEPKRALLWYDRYLAEDATGTYRAEALGRKLVVLDQLREAQKAREVAKRYLLQYPAGPYAKIARGLLGQP